MDIDLIFKIAAVGIIVSILNQVLSRSGREEQATMTSLAGLVVVLMILVQRIADLFELVKQLIPHIVEAFCSMDFIYYVIQYNPIVGFHFPHNPHSLSL